MHWLAAIGEIVVRRWKKISDVAGVVWTALVMAFKRSSWPRTTVDVFARQILFTGIEACRFVSLVALMVGISIVVQMQVFLAKVGESALLGPVLVMVIVREAAPLLVNFIVIGRSGPAIAAELGNMKIAGQVHVLDAQGIDPFLYLVMPRVLGFAISVFCLTILFIVVSFFSGYISGALLGANTGTPGHFVKSVFSAIRPADVLNVMVKTFVPGAVASAICCLEGLSVGTSITDVPQATTRAVVQSVTALFIISAVVSVVTYM